MTYRTRIRSYYATGTNIVLHTRTYYTLSAAKRLIARDVCDFIRQTRRAGKRSSSHVNRSPGVDWTFALFQRVKTTPSCESRGPPDTFITVHRIMTMIIGRKSIFSIDAIVRRPGGGGSGIVVGDYPRIDSSTSTSEKREIPDRKTASRSVSHSRSCAFYNIRVSNDKIDD